MGKLTKEQLQKYLTVDHKRVIIARHKKNRAEAKKKLEAERKLGPPVPKPAHPSVGWSTQNVARPYVTIQSGNPKRVVKKGETPPQICFPSVFLSPIRVNIVKFIHGNMAKNRRQPYAVFVDAGHQHSAESWGTGRAVSRIPRVSGGGTSRAGQGAFGNMCRSGRMFAPTRIWRKWHVKLNVKQKRYATVSCIAASAVPALVEARGHRISEVPEIPLVVEDRLQKLKKTKDAIALLEHLGAYEDVEKVKNNKKKRAGRGKMRNRRYIWKKGPLIVYKEDYGLTKAFRNLPGVDTCHVRKLNVLLLAPGGQVGRFIIWTKSAFEELNNLWGTFTQKAPYKKGFYLPRPCMTHPDLHRILNSAPIQNSVRAKRPAPPKRKRKKNPLKNFGAMVKLNPYALHLRRVALLEENRRKHVKKAGGSTVDVDRVMQKKRHQWRQRFNYVNAARGKTTKMSKEKYDRHTALMNKRRGRGKLKALQKKKEEKAEEKMKAYFKDLKEKAKAGGKPTLKQIKKMIERHNSKYGECRAKRRAKEKKSRRALKVLKRKANRLAAKKAKKQRLKKAGQGKGAKAGAKPEEAKPFKTYDNDECMGKEAPVAAIRKAKYVQGEAPKEGQNLVVLLWRKSYKAGYKFMPLYSALSDEFKDKPVTVVGVCLDRDKNAPAGFLKKYHNGPKGNFTTTFAIAEEWAPANKVYPLKGRDVEKGFLDNMVDLHPGMKEIPSIPHVFIVNSHGTIVWHQDHSERGAGAADHMDEVKDQLTRLLSGKPLLSFGSKIVEASDDEEESAEEDGDAAVGDMGDFFTNF